MTPRKFTVWYAQLQRWQMVVIRPLPKHYSKGDRGERGQARRMSRPEGALPPKGSKAVSSLITVGSLALGDEPTETNRPAGTQSARG